jgi:hypothetical protein
MFIEHSYLERAQQTLIYTHHGTCVVKFATVVRCTKQRNQLPLGEEFVTVLHHLMRSADQVHVVFLQEPGYDIGTEGEGDTAIVL